MWQLIENSQANTSDTKSNLQDSKHPSVTEATHNAHQSRKQSLRNAKETSAHHSVFSRQKQFPDTNKKCSFNFDSEEFVNSARSLNKLSRSQTKKRKTLNCDSENNNSDILYDRNKKDKLISGDELCEKKNRKYSKKRRSVREQESKITSTSTEKTELTNHIIPNANKSEGNRYTDRYFQYFALSSTEDMTEEIDVTHQKGMSENEYKCVDENNGCSSGNKKRKTCPAENKIIKTKCQSKVKSNKLSKLKKRMNSCDKNFSRSRENDSAGQNDSHDTSTSGSCILISHSADDSSGNEDIIPNTPPCSNEFHILKSRNEDSLFSAALVSTTNPKKKKLPTSHQKLSSEAVDVETDRNATMRSSTENSLKTEKHSAKSCKKINKFSAKSRNREKREKFTSVESESKTGSGDTDIHSEYLYKPMLDEDGEHSKSTEEASAIPHRSKRLASRSTETSSESSKRKETKEKKVKSNDLFQPNSLGCKEENSEMGIHTQHDQSLRLSHLTLEQIEEKFEKNIQYLRDIFKRERYCERHDKFNRGGFESLNLRYSALFTVPYTDDQLYHLLFLICSTYCPHGNFQRFYDYFMKVLLPELCIKIYMDEFSVTYDDALTQMESIPEEAVHGFCLSW